MCADNCNCCLNLSLDEILSDPITQLVMMADKVHAAELVALCQSVSKALGQKILDNDIRRADDGQLMQPLVLDGDVFFFLEEEVDGT